MKYTLSDLNTGNKGNNIILHALGRANPYCSFAFKQKKEGSRECSSVCFRCTGSCKFADCPVRFIVDAMSFVKCDPPRQLKSSVHFSSKYVRHDKTKTRFRWIHSVDRQCIATDLKYQLYIIQSLLNRLLRPALESGQRDGTDTS